MKLVIDRSKWLRAEGDDESRLLRPSDGKMCCLGFLGLECGIDDVDLNDNSVPQDCRSKKWPLWLFEHVANGEDVCTVLMIENDTKAREDVIARVFADNGVEVEFVDGPVSP